MSLDCDGFAIVDGILTANECDELIPRLLNSGHRSAGTRTFLQHPWCRQLAVDLRDRLSNELKSLVAVQCTYFHKSAESNWLVAWHQDRTIPVKSRIEAVSWSGWSLKESVTFVQPPDSVLKDLLAVRLYADDSLLENGPLQVLPGSHRRGALSPSDVSVARAAFSPLPCLVRRGGVVMMRPLLLHASTKSVSDLPRRVLHFLFAPPQLPDGASWADQV